MSGQRVLTLVLSLFIFLPQNVLNKLRFTKLKERLKTKTPVWKQQTSHARKINHRLSLNPPRPEPQSWNAARKHSHSPDLTLCCLYAEDSQGSSLNLQRVSSLFSQVKSMTLSAEKHIFAACSMRTPWPHDHMLEFHYTTADWDSERHTLSDMCVFNHVWAAFWLV